MFTQSIDNSIVTSENEFVMNPVESLTEEETALFNLLKSNEHELDLPAKHTLQALQERIDYIERIELEQLLNDSSEFTPSIQYKAKLNLQKKVHRDLAKARLAILEAEARIEQRFSNRTLRPIDTTNDDYQTGGMKPFQFVESFQFA